MKIVTPADNGPRAHLPGHGISMHDNQRRHNYITRRVTYAKEAGIIEAALPADSKNKVANAARALVQSYQLGKVSRQQIEEEQRADETRLKGWEVVKPQPGTIHAEEIPKIKYRMAVRARALEEIASLDLAVMISPTGHDQKGRPKVPVAKPWRAGVSHGSGGAKRGKPIGLREFNACHEPAGGPGGGQFSSKGSGNCSGDGGSGRGGGSGPATARPDAAGLRDRVKKIDPEKRLKYAEDRANRVIDYHDDKKNDFTTALRHEDPSEYAAPPGSKFARKAMIPPDYPPMPHDVDTDDYGPPSASSGGRQMKPPKRNDFTQAMRDEPSEYGAKPPVDNTHNTFTQTVRHTADDGSTPGRKLPIVHAGSPLRTNASINRDTALKAFKAGMTAREIARAWPAVFKVDSEGKLGQKYDYELGDGSGRYETNRMITRASLKDVLARHKAKAKR